jgi:hypothetical protein
MHLETRLKSLSLQCLLLPCAGARKGFAFGIGVGRKNVGLSRLWVTRNEKAGANVKNESMVFGRRIP